MLQSSGVLVANATVTTRSTRLYFLTCDAGAGARTITLKDGAGGTVVWQGLAPASTTLHVTFSHPLAFFKGLRVEADGYGAVTVGYK